MNLAERMLAAYAEVEPWTTDHGKAMRSYDLEETVIAANKAFEMIRAIDAGWNETIAERHDEYREEDDRRIGSFYEQWLGMAQRHLAWLRKTVRDYEIKGAEEFLLHIEEAQSILESRALEAEMLAAAESAKLAKGNPNPQRYGG